MATKPDSGDDVVSPETTVEGDRQDQPNSQLTSRGLAYGLLMLTLMIVTGYVVCHVLGGIRLPFQGLLSWPLGER